MVKQLVDVITICHSRTMIAFFDVVPLKRKSEKILEKKDPESGD